MYIADAIEPDKKNLRPPLPDNLSSLPYEEFVEAMRRHHAPTPDEIEEGHNFDYEDPGILLWQRRADDREKLTDLKQHARIDLERTLKRINAVAPLWQHREGEWVLLSAEQIGEILRFDAANWLGHFSGPVKSKP